MEAIIGGIYKITDVLGNKVYIGSTVNFKQRKIQHFYTLKTNKHANKKLQNFYNKYGIESLEFSVVEYCNNELDLLLEREQYWIDTLKPEFNIAVKAGSSLGIRKPEAKYYYLNNKGFYQTAFRVYGRQLHFGWFEKEEDAIEQVSYIKTLTDDEKITFKKSLEGGCQVRGKNKRSSNKTRKVSSKAKNYTFHKRDKKYMVKFTFNGVYKYFGSYKTEQEAVNRVIEVKKEYGIE